MKQSPLTTFLGLTALALGTAQVARTAEQPLSFALSSPPQAASDPTETATGTPAAALNFTPPVAAADQSANAESTVAANPSTPTEAPDPVDHEHLFQGGDRSLVARAVGSAEGTRTPDGGKTRAYYGHVDPGNRAWNLGSFSYQHGATSPEEADRKQLQRLQRQAQVIQQKAEARGLELTTEEALNGIDLANQAPLAALDTGGYVDRLKQAHEQGLRGTDAVLWARTYAFWDERRQNWDAPGLGNTVHSITHDQERRLLAIARAIAVQSEAAPPPVAAREKTANDVIFQDGATAGARATAAKPQDARDQVAAQILAQVSSSKSALPSAAPARDAKDAIDPAIVHIP